jgi:hypothetical protein
MFPTARRALDADGFRGTTLGLLLVVGLLAARLEMSQATHPVEAPVAGRVVATRLVLGQEVQGGYVLVELDATAQHLQREEEQARVRALTPHLEALHTVIAAEEQALREARHAARVALDEARARHREAEVAAGAADEEAELFARLQARGLPAQIDLLRAKAEAQKRRAAVDTLRLAVSRLESDHRTQESDRNARLVGLRRDVTRLAGDMTTAAATVSRVASEVRNGRVRVELSVDPDGASPIPLQHGLPGAVEVQVERVAPVTLVLRTAGKLLAQPVTGGQGERRIDE